MRNRIQMSERYLADGQGEAGEVQRQIHAPTTLAGADCHGAAPHVFTGNGRQMATRAKWRPGAGRSGSATKLHRMLNPHLLRLRCRQLSLGFRVLLHQTNVALYNFRAMRLQRKCQCLDGFSPRAWGEARFFERDGLFRFSGPASAFCAFPGLVWSPAAAWPVPLSPARFRSFPRRPRPREGDRSGVRSSVLRPL